MLARFHRWAGSNPTAFLVVYYASMILVIACIWRALIWFREL